MMGTLPPSWHYGYLIFSTALIAVWLVLFGMWRDIRSQMLRVSVATMLLGLTEPFFVPSYWNPPTLFELAWRTRFDLESLLFSFAIGGIVFSAYEAIFHVAPSVSLASERHLSRHRFHYLVVISPPVLFFLLFITTALNPIYDAAIALLAGFMGTLYCRPDLWKKMLVSGALFLVLYFAVLACFNLAYPGYIEAVWNLKQVSGLRMAGVPLEELMFAFTFGLYWSSTYEHIAWRRDVHIRKEVLGAPASAA